MHKLISAFNLLYQHGQTKAELEKEVIKKQRGTFVGCWYDESLGRVVRHYRHE
jgi:hypothetical protein